MGSPVIGGQILRITHGIVVLFEVKKGLQRFLAIPEVNPVGHPETSQDHRVALAEDLGMTWTRSFQTFLASLSP